MVHAKGRALPRNPYDAHSNKMWHDAYAECLHIQPQYNDDIMHKNLMYARVLGYLILEAPTHEGRNYICNEILSREGDELKLSDFADLFLLTAKPICESA